MTRRQRIRRDECKKWLAKAGDLPTARALARRRGFGADTSVWIGALGELLAESAGLAGTRRRAKAGKP